MDQSLKTIDGGVYQQVAPIKPTAPYSAQFDVDSSAAALTDHEFSGGAVMFKADDDNTGSIYLGAEGVTTSNGYRLTAGQQVPMNILELGSVYAIGSADNQKLHVLGS